MKRQFNTKLIFWVFGSFAVIAVAVHFLHGFQVRRNVGAYLRQAELALGKGDKTKAVTYWRTYFALAGNPDLQVMIQFTDTLEDIARSPRDRFEVWQKMNEILARDTPQEPLDPAVRDSIRFRLILQEIQLAMYPQAIKNITLLLPTWKKNPGDLEHMLGWCYEAGAGGNIADFEKAVEAFEAAYKKNPHKIESYVLRAEILRAKNLAGLEEVDQVMDEMVTANSKNHQAYLARSRYYRQQQNLVKAGQDIDAAQKLDLPKRAQAEVQLAAGELAKSQGDLANAKKHFENARKVDARFPPVYKALAGLELRLGQHGQAIKVLREGLKEFPEAADLTIFLADLLIDEGKMAEAEQLIGKLRQAGLPPALPDYLWARIVMTRKQWDEATALLERVRGELPLASDWACQVNALLGLCYEQVGDAEQQLAAFERALALDGSWTAARQGLATTLVALNRFDEALREYSVVEKAADAPPEIWTQRGRALLMRELHKPADKRRWAEVNEALDQADKATPKSVQVALLRAELLAAEKQYGTAKEVLEKARAQHPTDPAPWRGLVDLAARQGQRAQGLALLTQADNALGPRVELRLARARFWAALGGPEARAALQPLAKDIHNFRPEEQVRLLRALAGLWQRLGDTAPASSQRQADHANAETLWRQIVERQPRDIRGRFALLELALQNGRLSQAQALQKQLRSLEGSRGTLWRYGEAALWVHQAKNADQTIDRKLLEDARKKLSTLGRQRPDWPRIPLLEARIAELEGNQDEALRAYHKALMLGESQPRVLVRYVGLAFERREFDKAYEALSKLEEDHPLSKDLSRIAAEVALVVNPIRARDLAAQAVTPDTRDYRELLWLARIYLGVKDFPKAEAALRGAVQVAGRTPEPWIALVEYLVRHGSKEQAQLALEEARMQLPPERALLALARGHELLGDLKNAEDLWLKAVKAQPADFLTLFQAAEYYRRNDQPKEAEALLRKILEPATAAPGEFTARARRYLALLLAESNYGEALKLLDDNRSISGNFVTDVRARALVRASRPNQRPEAVKLFQRTLPAAPRSAEEQFWLLQLYDLTQEFDNSRIERNSLFTAYGDQPPFLAYCVRQLIQREELGEAQSCLDRLNLLEPYHLRTRELERALLKARENLSTRSN